MNGWFLWDKWVNIPNMEHHMGCIISNQPKKVLRWIYGISWNIISNQPKIYGISWGFSLFCCKSIRFNTKAESETIKKLVIQPGPKVGFLRKSGHPKLQYHIFWTLRPPSWKKIPESWSYTPSSGVKLRFMVIFGEISWRKLGFTYTYIYIPRTQITSFFGDSTGIILWGPKSSKIWVKIWVLGLGT